jgi:hypothetical protein
VTEHQLKANRRQIDLMLYLTQMAQFQRKRGSDLVMGYQLQMPELNPNLPLIEILCLHL